MTAIAFIGASFEKIMRRDHSEAEDGEAFGKFVLAPGVKPLRFAAFNQHVAFRRILAILGKPSPSLLRRNRQLKLLLMVFCFGWFLLSAPRPFRCIVARRESHASSDIMFLPAVIYAT
jgi:hypothetical protein